MVLCPECHRPAGADVPGDCPHCGWKREDVDGIPVLLSSTDRSSPVFRDYVANYDRIAADDLEDPLQPPRYLERAAETLLAFLPELEGRRVCELGVGRGLLLRRLLGSRAASVTGIDVSIEYLQPVAERAESRLRLALANAENLPFRDEFDVVVASEILEHVLNVGDLLISLHRSLVTGGRVVVRVPYKEDLRQYARQAGARYRFVHLRTFTRDSLVDLMEQAGFRLRKLAYDGHFQGRPRRLTPYLARVVDPYFARAFDEGVPRGNGTSPIVRALLRPVTLTAAFEKR
jgi:2-polyprenyl-3-methyl-5-hydroxy-6-metoxy-1,4-benzoquinol methylase